MGMTIAKPIQTLEYLRDSGVFPFQYKGVLYTAESIDVVIETMRKYQQIEEIVKQYKKFGNIDFSMQIISGVVENGNNKQ